MVVTHDDLSRVVINLPGDWEGYGTEPRERPDGSWGMDCAAGCVWYAELKGQLGLDWGVCVNAKSHRAGLLTFEHQGCTHFERRR